MAISFSSSNMQQKYEVFISFRGKDTRPGFISHLHVALDRKGIDTFVDYRLERGEEISQALETAIEESKISIVVLSKNYASSSWCLDELSKILECKKTNKQEVIPIFYLVDPSDVRHQKNSFEEAFLNHQRYKDRKDKVEKWKAALTDVAGLSGEHFKDDADTTEAKFVEDIAKLIWAKLNRELPRDVEDLVGMDARKNELEKLLGGMESDGVRIIGIWGMPGVGKTKTAEVFFKHISSQFDASCFLTNVRENRKTRELKCARNELYSKLLGTDVSIETPSIKGTTVTPWLGKKKVLIVLDDVSNAHQVEYLIGDGSCFGPGSTIIITSRDMRVLKQIAKKNYTVEKLTFEQALELFIQYAFRGNRFIDMEEFMSLSLRVVQYADGIPLALKILGSFLYNENKTTWESLLGKLKQTLETDIHNVFRISYDELGDDEKEIFLDVACFFEGEDINHVRNILDGCGFLTDIGIIVLINKSLVTILNNNLQMHNLIQEMGREIVRQESKHPGERSRLWIYNDINHILTTNEGTKKVEGIFLNMSNIEKQMSINSKAFCKMRHLRLLKIYNVHFQEDCKVHLPEDDLDVLPDNLVYLYWHCCPLKSLPPEFNPRKLVELHMHYSRIIRLWEGTPMLSCLKWIDLSYSQCLKEIPDLSEAPNLERINLVGCTSLHKIPSTDPSLPKLQEVYLSGCSNLNNFPLLSWNVKELHLDGTAIEKVPSEIQNFRKLVKLNMKNCKMLQNLPSIHCKLESLEFLDVSGCSSLMNIPEISWNLKELLLNETLIEELPSSIELFDNLVSLKLNNCTRIKYLPGSISKLKSLECLEHYGCSNLTNSV